MSYLPSSFIVWIAVLLATPAALAQTPSPGDYETVDGWGFLSISATKDGALTFQIDTVGANAHVCSLSGKIKGDTGYTDVEAGSAESEPQCRILFKAVPDGFEVSDQADGACHSYCGARAGFEGIYFLPPTGCKPAEREARRNLFTDSYRAKNYAHAYETLNSLYNQCGKFLNWIAIDEVRNDLAVTQYHLGHKDACLSILNDTIGAKQTNEQELSLPPADLDSYLPVAQATWYNLKLCGKAVAKSRPR